MKIHRPCRRTNPGHAPVPARARFIRRPASAGYRRALALIVLGLTFAAGRAETPFPYPCDLQQELIHPQATLSPRHDPAGDRFGRSIAVAGETIVVGADGDKEYGVESGAVFVLLREGADWLNWVRQTKITPPDRVAGKRFGTSVALSGITLVVGAPGDDERATDAGAAYVYILQGGVWSFMAKLTASDAATGDVFGTSVAVDGETLAVGAHGDDDAGSNSGAVYVFALTGGSWAQQAKLRGADTAAGDVLGAAVALSGGTLVAGASGDDGARADMGSAYVFTRAGTTWTQQAKLTASNAVQYDYFGCAVAIYQNTVVIGAVGRDINPANSATWDAGAAYIFTRTGTSWAQRAAYVGPEGNDHFGCSVDVIDGMVAVGGYRDGGRSGSVTIYLGGGTSWTMWTRWNYGAAGDAFGNAVALGGPLVANGTVLAVGAPGTDYWGTDSGAAYAARWSNNSFPVLRNLTGSSEGPSVGDHLGTASAWSGDILALGAPDDRDCGVGRGSVRLYGLQEGSWVAQAKVTASSGSSDQRFGAALALGTDTLAVGAAQSTNGCIHLFSRLGTNWFDEVRLFSPSPGVDTGFGEVLALSGDRLFVGAPRGPGRTTTSGAVYVYRKEPGNWVREVTLSASDGIDGDGFGSALAAEGDTVVVGAPAGGSHTTPTGTFGAVYVLVRSGSLWVEQAKLVGNSGVPSASEQDGFGRSVALSGNTVVVGAPLEASATGAVFAFIRQDTTWTLQTRLTVVDSVAGDQLGNCVALAGDTALVGAPLAQGTNYTGAVHVFLRSGTRWSEQARLPSCVAGIGNDLRGAWLGLQGNQILVGAPYANAPASQSGAGYLFNLGDPEASVAAYARQLLYWEAADSSPASPLSRERAAFRFKSLLYGTATNGVRSRLNSLGDLFGPEEEARAAQALELTRYGLLAYPGSTALRGLILDIYYDLALAGMLAGQDRLSEADPVRLGVVPPTHGSVLDDEIAVHTDGLAAFRLALSGHFELLSDGLGHPESPPLGYRIFKEEVPLRPLAPATCLSTNPDTFEVTAVPVTDDPAPLLDGYKDLVLLEQLLRAYGQTAADLARLHAARGDLDVTRALIAETERFLWIRLNLLHGLFPELAAVDPPGLAEAVAGINDSLGRLHDLRQLLRGEMNLLGFAPDFLFFVSRFTGGGTDHYDSYDAFHEYLVAASPQTGPLAAAQAALDRARVSYDTLRLSEDALAESFTEASRSYLTRLEDIVGVAPGQPTYGDDPTLNPGSELDQQYRSIEGARLRILRNRTQISNLEQRVEIERRRASDVAAVYIDYGDRRSDLVEEITHLKAAQAGVDSLLGNLSFDNPAKFVGSLVTGAINAGVQVGTQEAIGAKEAELERLAGMEKADVEGINSAAQVKTWLLEMRTLVIDSQEAGLQLRQELNRLQGLYREKAELERHLAELDTGLARRYFADPAHRLRHTADALRAHLAFDHAQRWTFFALRALEYKWNRPFVLPATQSPDGRSWQTQDLFQVRNAEQLRALYQAMDTFDALYSGPSTSDDRFDWFSVREHFLGYLKENAAGEPQVYVDPATGQTVDAVEAFRRHLGRLVVNGWIELDFSTVREIPNKSFFRGPTYFANGTLDPTKKGSYLDKIRWIKIRLPGDYAQQTVTGYLTYGGVSYLRNADVGTRDPIRPDRIRNETTAYSSRYWFYKDLTWRSTEGLTAEITVLKVPRTEPRLDGNPSQPDVLPSVNQIDVFKERSVAANGWHLAIPVSGVGSVPLEKLDDIEIYFYHWAFNRQ